MPMWRCPHCGTPQAETARCWVCRRSSTACLTCRHFRRGVAGKFGYCGLDRTRAPLGGDEIRSCWEAGTPPSALTIAAATPPTERIQTTTRDFVEVSRLAPPRKAKVAPPLDTASGTIGIEPDTERSTAMEHATEPDPARPEPRWSLWEDLSV